MERAERPSPDLLNALVSDLLGVLGDDLVGLYLYGSAVTGGFDVGVSDIDLAAVTSSEVESLDLAGLERMHGQFVERNPAWRDRLEIVYVGRANLESFRTSSGSLAVISPGEPFHVRRDRLADWLQNWYLIRETSETLWGAPASAVVPPIARSEFVAATRRYAGELRDRSRVGVEGGTLSYTILTLCRALRTVEMQAPSSKQEAAAWTRDRMPEWAWLIDAALAYRLSGGRIGLDDVQSRAAAETFITLLHERNALLPEA